LSKAVDIEDLEHGELTIGGGLVDEGTRCGSGRERLLSARLPVAAGCRQANRMAP
jgi:hypothetical protein